MPLEHQPAPALGDARGEGVGMVGTVLQRSSSHDHSRYKPWGCKEVDEPRMRAECASLSQSPFAVVRSYGATQRILHALKLSERDSLSAWRGGSVCLRSKGVVTMGGSLVWCRC